MTNQVRLKNEPEPKPSRLQLDTELYGLMKGWDLQKRKDLLITRYKVNQFSRLSVGQIQDLILFLKAVEK